MTVKQISAFVQSKPGHLNNVLDAFEEAHVSVRGFCASDTGDYGVVRFIVDDPDKGIAVLKEKGAAATVSDVLVVKLHEAPGELARMWRVFAEVGINISYSYSLISNCIVLKVDDVEEAKALLAKTPVELVSQAMLQAEGK